MSAQPDFPPEFEPPQPGERYSLDQIFLTFEVLIERLTEEALLHVEMYPDPMFTDDLLTRMSNARQGLQIAETQVSQLCMELQ